MIRLEFSLIHVPLTNKHRQKQVERIVRFLATEREKKGLSQRQLSAKLRMHAATVGKIERFERAVSLGELLAILDALGLTLSDIASVLRDA